MASTLSQEQTGSVSSRLRQIELPWLILAAMLLATLLAAFQSSRQLRADADARFAEIVQAEKRALDRQLGRIESGLTSARAFVAAMPTLNQATWETYVVASFGGRAAYSGLVGVQFVPRTGPSGSPATLSVQLTAPLSVGEAPIWSTSAEVGRAVGLAESTSALIMSQPLNAATCGLPSGVCVAVALPSGTGVAAPLSSESAGTTVAIIDLAAMAAAAARETGYPVIRELLEGEKRLLPTASGSMPSKTDAEMSMEVPVEFGQRVLRLSISSTPQLERTLRSNMPRAILVVGVGATMLLGVLVLFMTRLRQQAESLAAGMTRKLLDQTRFTEDLIEFNPNPIFRKDNAGRLISVNQAWEQLSGRNRKDVLGKPNQDLQSSNGNSSRESNDTAFLASPSGYEANEVFITNADGREFETIVAKKVLRRADGSVDGMIGTITDVTLIKKLERELARQREQLDLVIRSSQQGIWDIDLSGAAVPYYSERFREVLGYTSGAFPASFAWPDHVHPEDAAEVRRRVIAHFKGETQLFDIESRVKRKDGSYMWVRVRAIAQRNATGRAVRFVGSISDVTDRKIAEVELREANVRVTEAAQAKESFLATMSHEIRTPLNGVLGMASLLSETNLNDEQRDYIRLIRSSGDTLLRLIGDVLDFSKIESGQMTLESVVVEIAPLVEEAFELVAEKAREKRLALLFDIDESVPYYILGDATRLRQIVLNLLSNAIKFTEKGEVKLELRTRNLPDGQLELEGRVSDTGIGIPADRAKKLFQPFTQVDASTTRKYGGTGLGLAIVRRLSQLMGGDVGVESIEGKGSTFFFTVRTKKAEGQQKPYMQRNLAGFLDKRLLVVDRNASRRKIQQLRYAGWGLGTVTCPPEEAVRILAQEPPFDILLTEMEMPTPETEALRAALEKDDRARNERGERPISIILQSTISRAELSQGGVMPSLRHDAFIMRPAGLGRIFDVFMRAALNQPNLEVATRPYTPAPVYDPEYQAALTIVGSNSEPGPTATIKSDRVNLLRVRLGGRAPRILVAEDNEVNQQVILGMLKNFGCESDLAPDGRVAVNKAIEGRYDVILMDIHMPELDGVTAMQNIRGLLVDGTCPPIVAMTAHALPGDRERYLSMGMNDYISKPIRSEDLKRLFQRIFPVDASNTIVHTEPKTPTPATTGSAVATPLSEELPILDTDQIEDLRYLPAGDDANGNEQDAVGGLIRLFQTKAIERMADMENLLVSEQWTRLAEVAHSMRGSSASMGFPRVAAKCKELELAARGNQKAADAKTPLAENLEQILARLKFYNEEADSALRDWLSKNAAPKN